MSVTVQAVFQDADAADLALRDLKAAGCALLSRETGREAENRAFPAERLFGVSRTGGEIPPPYPDNGAYFSLRVPQVENRATAGIDPGDIWSDRVTLSVEVPEDKAAFAKRQLINRGGSRVRFV